MVTGTMEASSRRGENTRQRLLDTALRLFGEHGVEGASLQMIADELGVTKAAVYYHFKTKHEIVAAVAAPVLSELTAVLDTAETIRRRSPMLDSLLDGLVDIVIRNRMLIALFLSDPGLGSSLGGTLNEVEGIKVRLAALASGEDADAHTRVRTHYAIAGLMLGATGPDLDDIDDETLRSALLDSARRLLGRPRRG